jgi:hypothetical protein
MPFPRESVPETLEYHQAFNAGSDARLVGVRKCDNPHASSSGGGSLYMAWRAGWLHVHQHWGSEPGAYPVQPLPVVQVGRVGT